MKTRKTLAGIAFGMLLAFAGTTRADERRGLLQDIRLAPAWMHPIFRELAAEEA